MNASKGFAHRLAPRGLARYADAWLDRHKPGQQVAAAMKAIRVHQVGPPLMMQLEDVPDPQPGPGMIMEGGAYGKIALIP